MGLFKKFSAPKAKIELKLDEVYAGEYRIQNTEFMRWITDYRTRVTGRIILDPQEEISVNEFRLEFSGSKKVKWKKGFSSLSTSSLLETRKIPTLPIPTYPVKLQKGQHYEQPFQILLPLYSRSDPFTEIEVKVKGVATVQGRPDLTHEVKLGIIFPYVIECLRQYGGCGFITPPLSEPIKVCPKCNNNLEEVWNRKYSDELTRFPKVSKMIPCAQCGSLVPETSNFCPNCGARRKI